MNFPPGLMQMIQAMGQRSVNAGSTGSSTGSAPSGGFDLSGVTSPGAQTGFGTPGAWGNPGNPGLPQGSGNPQAQLSDGGARGSGNPQAQLGMGGPGVMGGFAGGMPQPQSGGGPSGIDNPTPPPGPSGIDNLGGGGGPNGVGLPGPGGPAQMGGAGGPNIQAIMPMLMQLIGGGGMPGGGGQPGAPTPTGAGPTPGIPLGQPGGTIGSDGQQHFYNAQGWVSPQDQQTSQNAIAQEQQSPFRGDNQPGTGGGGSGSGAIPFNLGGQNIPGPTDQGGGWGQTGAVDQRNDNLVNQQQGFRQGAPLPGLGGAGGMTGGPYNLGANARFYQGRSGIPQMGQGAAPIGGGPAAGGGMANIAQMVAALFGGQGGQGGTPQGQGGGPTGPVGGGGGMRRGFVPPDGEFNGGGGGYGGGMRNINF